MALPTSRNRTYAPGVDIASADLNALQDCIIARKHGSLSFPIDPGAFHIVGQTSTTHIRPLGGPWAMSGHAVPMDLGYWLPIPVGTRLNAVTWYYNRGGAGTLTLRVLKANQPAGLTGTTLLTSTINSGTGFTSTTVAPAYALETDHTLVLWARADNTAQSFGGAIVTLDKI